MRQRVEEGLPRQAVESVADAVKAATRHGGDLESRKKERDGRHVIKTVGGLDETMGGSDRAAIGCKRQQGDHTEDQKYEEGRVALAEVSLLRKVSLVGRKAAVANTLAREDQTDAYIAMGEAPLV